MKATNLVGLIILILATVVALALLSETLNPRSLIVTSACMVGVLAFLALALFSRR